jgi:hypothetical protein
MSKMDNLRAMREARYEQAAARAAKNTPRRASAPMIPDAPKVAVAADSESEEALCGHRAIRGRTCTREAGHAVKSHRYA